MRIAFTLGLTTVVLAGCIVETSDTDPISPTDPTDPTDPTPPPPAPVPMVAGTYKLHTSVEITAEALLPEQLAGAVETLRSFSMNPGATLLDLAEEAGVPAVGTLRAALPDALENKLVGWINDEIAGLSIGGYPLTSYVRDVVMLAETSLGGFGIDSELEVNGASGTHRLRTLDLGALGTISLDLAGDILTQTPAISSTPTTLAIGGHTFGLAYGTYLWRGLDNTAPAVLGGTIRQVLGAVVNCPAVAQNVADQCLLSVCVGHAAELTSICEAGLDAAVEYARDRISAMRVDALQLASGRAGLVDADHDLSVEALTDGTWDASLNLGRGLRHSPATFAGERSEPAGQ